MAASLEDFITVIIGWMRGQYEFDPVAAELNFGDKESPETALEIDLGGGRKLALQGRIDRVDLWREPGKNSALAVVTDYKSGGNKLDALLVANGVQLQLLAYLAALRRWKNPRAIFGVDELTPAGAFYVSLRGKFEGGDTRDEILGDADSRRLAYRHNGRFDAGVQEKLDSANAADQFNYSRNKDGSLRKGSTEALPHTKFNALLDHVEEQIRDFGKRIFYGEASVNPYRKGQETPCKFCDYRAACRIDEWTHEWRVLHAGEQAVSDTPEPS
jgi:ATP-dependent helicase/nuclease subunit B